MMVSGRGGDLRLHAPASKKKTWMVSCCFFFFRDGWKTKYKRNSISGYGAGLKLRYHLPPRFRVCTDLDVLATGRPGRDMLYGVHLDFRC